MATSEQPLVAIVMGSNSDWPTMKRAAAKLDALGILHKDFVASAHRTPVRVDNIAKDAQSGLYKVIIAGAGGAAHLAGVLKAHAPSVPVLAVPIRSAALQGLDSLLATVQMPSGVPVATFAIDGAENAAIFAAEILAIADEDLRARLLIHRIEMANAIPEHPYDQPAVEKGEKS